MWSCGVALGVLEDAWARQRRRRQRWLLAIVVTVVSVSLLTVAFRHGANSGVAPSAPTRSTHLPITTASCTFAPRPPTRGLPSRSLLSILGVLRRPATRADTFRADFLGFTDSVYVDDIRLARTVHGGSFYVVPVRVLPCGRLKPKQYDTVLLYFVHRVAGRVLDSSGSSGSTASQIQQVGMSAPPRDGFIYGIVPDGVATVTMRYPSATFRITAVGNVIAAHVGYLRDPYRPLSITWRSANGATVMTSHNTVL
jgi:hypothetical protein